MKNWIQALSVSLLVSCGQQDNITNTGLPENAPNTAVDSTAGQITFYEVDGRAILIGDSINLLDENFDPIKDISFLNEQLVDITAVSTNYHKANPNDDYCEEFKYVKIRTSDFEGYVDGRKVYELIDRVQNKTITLDDNQISFTATAHFGVGVSNSEGITGCLVNTPVIFADKISNYEGLVRMVSNENYSADYPYFELKDDDGANDQIARVEMQGNVYLVTIERTFQEGAANLLVAIYKDAAGTFVAEIRKQEWIEE